MRQPDVYRTRDIVTILGLHVRDPAVREVIEGIDSRSIRAEGFTPNDYE